MECHPEEDNHSKDETEANDALLRVVLGRNFCFLCLFLDSSLLRCANHVSKGTFAQIVDKDRGNHAHAGHGKGKVIGIGLAVTERRLCPVHNSNGCRGCKQSADVDGHIEEGEARVALVGKLRIVIEVAHHDLQVALEETCSKRDKQEACTHCDNGWSCFAQRHRQDEVTDEHYHNAQHDHLAIAILVGKHATKQGQQIYDEQEVRERLAGPTRVETKVVVKEKDKDGQHGVVTKALARIGKSQRPKTFRLPLVRQEKEAEPDCKQAHNNGSR